MPDYPYLLVTDFDGTITGRDFYELAIERVPRDGMPDYWTDFGAGRITHFEAMRGIYSRLRCTEEEACAMAAAMQPDPDLRLGVEQLRAGGWDVVVVSAGSSWYIDQVLEAEGVEVTVYANPGRFSPEEGLVLELPAGSPYFCRDHGIDKEAVVREALGSYEQVAFAGNGPPDLAAALRVPADLRFARGWLAGELSMRELPFVAYRRWAEVAERLVAGP